MEEGRRYYVVNMVRREETRLLRIKSPDTHRFVQLVCKNRFRIGRGQNVQISEEILHDCWDELKLKQDRGIVVVRVDHPTAGPKFLFENRPVSEPVPAQVVEQVQVEQPRPDPISVEPVQVEPEPVQAEPVPAQEPEPVPEPTPKIDPTRMKKSELIRYVAELMGEDPDQYESMTKKELLELVQ